MRQKINASRTLQKTSDPDKVKNLKDKIFKIEEDLRKHIHKRRSDEEKRARKNLNSDPKPLFTLVKKLTKKLQKLDH